jgi:hypothetical protein
MSATATRIAVSAPHRSTLAGQYIAGADTANGRKCRRHVTEAFVARFGDFDQWLTTPVADRLSAALPVRSFAAWAAVTTGVDVDAAYVAAAHSKWGLFLTEKYPQTAAAFRAEAASLGFDGLEVDKMWSKLAQISVIAGCPPDLLTAEQYVAARDAFAGAVMAQRGHRPKTLATPLFGLDAVMFQRGQAPVPALRKPWAARSVHEVDWDQVAAAAPTMAATMRRYLTQVAISLRPSSVEVIDTTLRQLAGMLVAEHPEVTTVACIARQHIEEFKTWLAARPGYRKQSTLSKTTLGMRMGHLRAFFERIADWDYDDVPARIPVFAADRPLKDRPLPKSLPAKQASPQRHRPRARQSAEGNAFNPIRNSDAWRARKRIDEYTMERTYPVKFSLSATVEDRKLAWTMSMMRIRGSVGGEAHIPIPPQ